MLSDASIQRDKNYSLSQRALLKLRAKCASNGRAQLDAVMREKLKSTEFTIFSNNCLGGIIYHDAGKRFTSPLINTAMDGDDFIRFLERPQYYLGQKMRFITWPGHNYPIAQVDDIEIRFVHYKSNQEAEQKFRERAKRICWDNILVVATKHDGLGRPDLMKRFDQLPYRKVMYVSNDYPQYNWAVCVPQFRGRFQVRIMTNYANFHGWRYYETAFNMADWIAGRA